MDTNPTSADNKLGEGNVLFGVSTFFSSLSALSEAVEPKQTKYWRHGR